MLCVVFFKPQVGHPPCLPPSCHPSTACRHVPRALPPHAGVCCPGLSAAVWPAAQHSHQVRHCHQQPEGGGLLLFSRACLCVVHTRRGLSDCATHLRQCARGVDTSTNHSVDSHPDRQRHTCAAEEGARAAAALATPRYDPQLVNKLDFLRDGRLLFGGSRGGGCGSSR